MGSITVNRNELAAALAFASLGLSKRPVCPVLGGMKVTISSGTLELAAFDYETTARAKVNGPWLRGRPQDGGDASVLVTGSELATVIKSLPRGRKVSAVLEISGDGLMVECEGTLSTVAAMGPDAEKEYPALPALPEVSGYADGQAFAAAVARVAVCAGRDDTLPALTCVKIGSEGGALELAATDRYRLGVDRIHWTGPDDVSALVPAVTLAKLAAKMDTHGKVSLHFGERFAGFSDGTRTLIVATRDLEFPKYRGLIRDERDDTTTVLVVAAALEAAVTRAGKLAGRNERTSLDIGPDGITVTAMRDGKVAGAQVVPCVLEGAALEAGFNAEYLASVLSGIEGEAWIGLANDSKPARVTSGSFTAIVMPVRVQA